MKLSVSIDPKRVVGALVLVVLFLTLLSVASQVYRYLLSLPKPNLYGYGPLFYLGQEQNIPTWYSTFALLLCSGLLATIYLAKRNAGDRYARHWGVLALVFVYLSADEAASLHEKVGRLLKIAAGSLGHQLPGFLSYGWVIPASFVVLIFALAYLKFLLHLPMRQRLLFFVAAGGYVGGAILLEMVAAYYTSLYGGPRRMTNFQNFNLTMIASTEEVLEMASVVVFVYALLAYLRSELDGITFRIRGG